MTTSCALISAAIEPAAKLSEVSPADGIAVLRGSDGTACVMTDPSASWGLGSDAARLTIERVRAFSGASVSDAGALSRFVEESAFQAEARLAREAPDTDTLFAGALVTVQDGAFSWASAGDLLIALCSVRNISWLNADWLCEGGQPPKLVKKSADWYPGLLGCTRAQRSGDLFIGGGPFGFGADQLLLILSQAVWSKLDDESILQEARRVASLGVDWRPELSESLLRIAKSRGAGGHRAAVGFCVGSEQSTSNALSRSRGYRALTIEEAGEKRALVEERESEREVLAVNVGGVSDGVVTVEFRNPPHDLNRATARGLVFELVLEGLFDGRYRSANAIKYVDSDCDVAATTPYTAPW
ncbi:MAG: hypothetical protein QM756_45700 [Polyangiaceae bacterium]